ncbi:MAG: hypothetical protein Q8R15_01190 [Candidatus Micrarchaeota archaeon]|nr:hypothetical protein [Candidatus Micrarchaeota archaeon]
MTKFVTAIVAAVLVFGSVGLFMLPAPQGSSVGVLMTPTEKLGVLMRPAESHGVLMQPQQKSGLIGTIFPINYPSVERVGFIHKPSPARAGVLMYPDYRG